MGFGKALKDLFVMPSDQHKVGKKTAGVATSQTPVAQLPPMYNNTEKQDTFSDSRIKFLNVSDGEMISQRCLIVHGHVEGATHGTIEVTNSASSFLPVPAIVSAGLFKATVRLDDGYNTLHFDFRDGGFSTTLNLVYIPPDPETPRIHLAIVLARDSKGTYDCPPDRAAHEPPSIERLVEKFRTAAYLWQAFTAEQMRRAGYGRRSFAFYEDMLPDTLGGTYKPLPTAVVHLVRSDLSKAELQDPDKAQQNPKAKDQGALYGIAIDAIRNYGGPFHNSVTGDIYVSALLADAHWRPDIKLLTGHAALGGCAGNLNLGIFGSHSCFAWPASLAEVEPAFMDTTPVDERYVRNDLGETNQNWEVVNVGIGAFMHETGHALKQPHRPYGVMLRSYTTLNRSFVSREPPNSKTGRQGPFPCRAKDECGWHPLDMVSFRFNPLFKFAGEPPTIPLDYDAHHTLYDPEAELDCYEISNNSVLLRSYSGISSMEVEIDGNSKGYALFVPPGGPFIEIVLDVQTLLPFVCESDARKALQSGKVNVGVCSGHNSTINGIASLFPDITGLFPAQPYQLFRSQLLGQKGGDKNGALFTQQLRSVTLFAGSFFDGIEFNFVDGTSAFVGHRGGDPHEINFDPDEYLVGLDVRAGYWIDAVGIITNKQRSPTIGGTGGSRHILIPPKGYTIAGVHGESLDWLYKVGIVYRPA
ncbi:hypothetical protein CANCADRAFT_135287 [Tortispora caseinolytica NRRL Y-17796]|uniref:Jacalin-type lectin domain-containing protein n=1 Tax=Tortispora caseinolytica NRRL Y-17796 TaxID=767744 RepID=A0A1E4TBW1_9ASCO|nr:hypothetical protein CANCADRAFT_135287 [Tortispora caseinolytica NRRL Y-17796]